MAGLEAATTGAQRCVGTTSTLDSGRGEGQSRMFEGVDCFELRVKGE